MGEITAKYDNKSESVIKVTRQEKGMWPVAKGLYKVEAQQPDSPSFRPVFSKPLLFTRRGVAFREASKHIRT